MLQFFSEIARQKRGIILKPNTFWKQFGDQRPGAGSGIGDQGSDALLNNAYGSSSKETRRTDELTKRKEKTTDKKARLKKQICRTSPHAEARDVFTPPLLS